MIAALLSQGAVAQSTGAGLPHIERRGAVSQLIVKGQPFLVLGGEVHNSSSSNRAYMEPVWPRLAAMNLNTVLVPVSWEQIEPQEGVFDFTLVDALITDARKNGLKLGLLWFGTWKNLVSSYAPAWVRRDTARFPLAEDGAGNRLPILSTFGRNTQTADARAFSSLMRHLREIDAREQTVVMVQVQNEVGLADAERDRGAPAERAFSEPVPRELIDHLVRHKLTLSGEMAAVWNAAGGKTAGTWAEVFGAGPATNEIFMAWNYARYVDGVVAEGHADYPLPLFVNAAIGRQDGRLGTYPSGGPLPLVLNVWQAGSPRIGMMTPDIYYGDFADWSRKYSQSGNPLFIPETRGGGQGAGNALLAIGNYGAIGISPFGIDALPASDEIGQSYEMLKQMSALVLAHQTDGTTRGVVVDATKSSSTVTIGQYRLNIQLRKDRRSSEGPERGYALIVAEPGDRFTIGGKDVQITFADNGRQPATIGLDLVEEGSFAAGKWVPSRRLNGDEIMLDYGLSALAATRQNGTGLRFLGGKPQIIRVNVFPIR